MAKGNHSFTEQDIRKRFSAIVGHTVAEVDRYLALPLSYCQAFGRITPGAPSLKLL